MKIYVVTSSSNTVSVNVNENDTVKHLKDIIQDKEGIPCDLQRLSYNSRCLPNHFNIRDCSLDDNSIVSLSMGLQGGVQVNIKPIGKAPTFSIEMELSETVEHLKSRIQESQGISQEDISLAYRGKTLPNEAYLDTINQLKSKGQITVLMKQNKKSLDVKKEQTEEENESEPQTLCKNNCGFYG